jgi:hypothetical protein
MPYRRTAGVSSLVLDKSKSYGVKNPVSQVFAGMRTRQLRFTSSLQVLLNQPPQLVAVVTLHVDELDAVAIGSGIPHHSCEMDRSKS